MLRMKNPVPEQLRHHEPFPHLELEFPLKPRIEPKTARNVQIVCLPQRDGSFVASVVEAPQILIYDRSRRAAEKRAEREFAKVRDLHGYLRHALATTRAVAIDMELRYWGKGKSMAPGSYVKGLAAVRRILAVDQVVEMANSVLIRFLPKRWLSRLPMLLALVLFAVACHGQESIPSGSWLSARSATYTNPFLAGSEIYLDINVAADGSFRGSWQQYICLSSPGAYGVNIISCSLPQGGRPASGRLGSGGKGEIELDQLGRSTFRWTSLSADQLSIELPKNWHSTDSSVLHRARLWRRGKVPDSAGYSSPPPPPDASSPLSANLMYREFDKDPAGATMKYAGKTVVLEGRRGTLIELSTGGAAVHIPDGYVRRSMVLVFPDPRPVRGIAEGAKFRFRCVVEQFRYRYVEMYNCVVAAE